MRFAAAFVIALACSGASASEPGQPVDYWDFVYSGAMDDGWRHSESPVGKHAR